MRIAITGAQSTGKSTLLKYLKKDTDLQGFEFIEELTRQIAAKGININEEGSNFSQIFTVTIHAENIVKKHFISDRCALDGLVYTKWLYDNKKVSKWMLDYAIGVAKEVLPRYDLIYYLSPEFPIEDDGIRSANVTFRDEILSLFEHYIKEFNLNVITLTGSVAARAKQFKRPLRGKVAMTATFSEVFSIADLHSLDNLTDNYLTSAYKYWVENKYADDLNCKIFTSEKDGNRGWAFIREEKGSCHLSRFTVELKGDGLGTDIFEELKKRYSNITLWSNPEAKGFYTRHGVRFSNMNNKVEGKTYTYGTWKN
jgi:nicotinamide riboside kinase